MHRACHWRGVLVVIAEIYTLHLPNANRNPAGPITMEAHVTDASEVNVTDPDSEYFQAVGFCNDGLVLSTSSNTSCRVLCAPGYQGLGGNYECAYDALPGASGRISF